MMPSKRNKRVTGRGKPSLNKVEWKPVEGIIPMRHVVTGNRLAGAVGLIAGLPWVFHATRYLLEEIGRTGFDAGQFFLFLLVFGGLFFTLFGFSQFIYREETRIDGQMAGWSRRGLSGSKAWQEPLSDYRGVLKDYMNISGQGSSGTSYTQYTLSLYHDESFKRVRLYESDGTGSYPPDEWDRLWTHYAKLFRLPVLNNDGKDMTASSVEDLARPLKDKLKEGKIRIPDIDPDQAELPAGIAVAREGDQYIITLKPARYIRQIPLLLAIAICMLSLAGALYFHLGTKSPFPVVLIFSIVVLAGVVLQILSVMRKSNHPDEVTVDADMLKCKTWSRRHGWNTRSIAITDIRDITLRSDPPYPRSWKKVVIETKTTSFKFSEGLPVKSCRYLRDLLLFCIA
jgi:hypothetical protein